MTEKTKQVEELLDGIDEQLRDDPKSDVVLLPDEAALLVSSIRSLLQQVSETAVTDTPPAA